MCNFDVNVLTLRKGEVERDLSPMFLPPVACLFDLVRFISELALRINLLIQLFSVLILKRDWLSTLNYSMT